MFEELKALKEESDATAKKALEAQVKLKSSQEELADILGLNKANKTKWIDFNRINKEERVCFLIAAMITGVCFSNMIFHCICK